MAAQDGDRSTLITFGIELEFLVACLPGNVPDPDPKDTRDVYITDPLPSYVELPMESEDRRQRLRYWDQGSAMEPIIRHRIAHLLRCHNIDAISDSGDGETEACIERAEVMARNQLKRPKPMKLPTGWDYGSFWAVDTDVSVDETRAQQYDYVSVEVKSPVLYYNQTSVGLVRYVANLLASHFRILLNESTMFHVHVGRGGAGFSGNDLRTTAAFLWAAAPRIDQLHPIHCGPLAEWAPSIRTHSLMGNLSRRGACRVMEAGKPPGRHNRDMTTLVPVDTVKVDPHGNHLPNPVRDRSLMAHELLQQWKGHQRAHVFGVEHLWKADTINNGHDSRGNVVLETEGVYRSGYGAHYRPAYNFANLTKNPAVKKTIEFRQHCGTMSADVITTWIHVAAGCVDFCVHAPRLTAVTEVMRKLERPDPNANRSFEMNSDPYWMVNVTHTLPAARQGGNTPPYSVYDLLRDLALLPQAEYYEKRGLHPLPPDMGWINKRSRAAASPASPAGSSASNLDDTESLDDTASLDDVEPLE